MTPKQLLTEAIKKTGMQGQIKNIWILHPLLEQMALKLADYIGLHAIDANGEPLLVSALKKASTEYSRNVDDGMNEEVAMAGFIRSLLDSGTFVFNQEISIDTIHGSIMWQPFAGSLTAFIDGNKSEKVAATVRPAAIKKSIATAFVSMWLVPPEVLNTELWAEILNTIED